MTFNQSEANRVGQYRRDNGDRCRCLLDCKGSVRAARHDDIGPEPNQLVRKQGQWLLITICIAVDDVDVPALDVTEFLQTLREATPMCGSCRGYRGQDSDKRPPGRNLGDDCMRPRGYRTTNKRNELTPPHSRPPIYADARLSDG